MVFNVVISRFFFLFFLGISSRPISLFTFSPPSLRHSTSFPPPSAHPLPLLYKTLLPWHHSLNSTQVFIQKEIKKATNLLSPRWLIPPFHSVSYCFVELPFMKTYQTHDFLWCIINPAALSLLKILPHLKSVVVPQIWYIPLADFRFRNAVLDHKGDTFNIMKTTTQTSLGAYGARGTCCCSTQLPLESETASNFLLYKKMCGFDIKMTVTCGPRT